MFSVVLCRSILEEEETSIDQLEQKLDKILKMCGMMVDSGKTYVAQQRFVGFAWGKFGRKLGAKVVFQFFGSDSFIQRFF